MLHRSYPLPRYRSPILIVGNSDDEGSRYAAKSRGLNFFYKAVDPTGQIERKWANMLWSGFSKSSGTAVFSNKEYDNTC